MSKLRSRFLLSVIVFALTIGFFAIYMLLSNVTPNKKLSGTGGDVATEVSIGGDFELTDHNGDIFNSDNLKGRLSLVYFGFTYCPDICPTSLMKLTQVLEVLDKYQIDIVPIFITVDPKRDAQQTLKQYLSHFHHKFIGLTGTNEEIRNVADKFKIYYARSYSEGDDEDYMIDHSSFVYLLGKDGKYMKHFYFESKPEEIIEFIRINK
ncbi:MAG: SCO family protein [Rickettsiaceae bacterium]